MEPNPVHIRANVYQPADRTSKNRAARTVAYMTVTSILFFIASAAAHAGETSFRAQSGEIDASDFVIAGGSFGVRRDSISGWNNWSTADATSVADLEDSDNSHYFTWDPGSGDNAAMIFEYSFDDDRDVVSRIAITIEVAQAYNDDALFIYLWDYATDSYVVLGSMSGTRDTILSYEIEVDAKNYLSATGDLTLFVVNQDDYGSQAYIVVDHVAVTVIVAAPHFSISHSGSGSTCSPSAIAIEKHNSEHGIDTTFVGSIDLSTSTGEGTWSLAQGNGAFSHGGSGTATYAFAIGDSGRAVFGLTHSRSASVNIEVGDGVSREDSGEDPTLLVTAPGTNTVRDSFDSRSYSGNNGSADWATSWIEVGESNGAAINSATVSNARCSSGYCLRIGTGFSGTENFSDRGARREVDLLGASAATLSFTYRRGYATGTGTATVAVSNDGGANFSTLSTYALNGNTTTGITESFDISSYISESTQIRFLASVTNGTTSIYIDDIQVAYETTCPADGHFVIGHDTSAVHCQNEPFSVTAKDAGGVDLTDYGQAISLTTQTGTGTFLTTASNRGTFDDATAGDGLAAYTFSELDNGIANFLLYYSGGASDGAASSIDIDVHENATPSFKDDDSEGLLAFAPSAFMLTANALPNPTPDPIDDPVNTKIAATTFSIHIAAFGTTSADPSCGIIESYAGAKSISFWSSYVDPTTGTRSIFVNGTPIGESVADSTNMEISFSRGQTAVTAKYKDAGRVRLSASATSSAEIPDGILGATDAFVSLPAEFEVSGIQRADSTPNPQVDTPTGEPFVAAGQHFRATVRSLDAEGDPTPNFGHESVPEGLALTSATLVAPAGGRNGVLDDGSIENGSSFSADAEDGSFSGSTFSFSEVGAIRLRAQIADMDYLGAGNVQGSLSEVVGRFTPHHFELTGNTPRWRTACAIGAFSWAGQPFSFDTGNEPVLQVEAVNAGGSTTANYEGAWWRLTNLSLANRAYSISIGAMDASDLPAASSDPTITAVASGHGTLTFSSGGGISLLRQTPFAPADGEIELSIDILDLDGVAYPSNPFRFGGTTTGTGIAFDVSKQFHFGRLRIENAAGSERVDLPLRLVAQRFDGMVFVDDDFDSCSSIAEANLTMTPSPAPLVSIPTIANNPLLSGNGGLILSAPNSVGSIDISVILGPSGANLPWLRYDWPEDGNLDGLFDDDPSARATFGIWSGRDQLIYMREVY